MHVSKAKIRNYRCLQDCEVSFNPDINIIVGDNECGKSTLLEAINLALSGLLNGRPVSMELHPHLFNAASIAEYIDGLRSGKVMAPPAILIEVFLDDNPLLSALKGTNNSSKSDVPGAKMLVEFNEDYAEEYEGYVSDPNDIRTVPVEYYVVRWRSFADNDITSRSIPIKPSFIDASAIRNTMAANRYVVDIMKDSLDKRQQADLALSYRMMKDRFLSEEKVKSINTALHKKKGDISEKLLSVSLDTSSRASWETGVMPHLDDIPLTLVGKGEQNSVKIKLALQSSEESHIVLIEEAENHLSHTSLNGLIQQISNKRGHRQLFLTTHSSFVLNKLGIEKVILFALGNATTLNSLDRDTKNYFMKLSGYDTLRLILAKRAILVEGPSDDLVVQRAYRDKHGKLPIEDGVDVIEVTGLAFKRFLEIARLLRVRVDVVTDNDGDVNALQQKYSDYAEIHTINIRYDGDENYKTLEPQLLKVNGRDKMNRILGRSFSTDHELLDYMSKNKTDVALTLFESGEQWTAPGYINSAVT